MCPARGLDDADPLEAVAGRLRLISLRPLAVRIRARKPILWARFDFADAFGVMHAHGSTSATLGHLHGGPVLADP